MKRELAYRLMTAALVSSLGCGSSPSDQSHDGGSPRDAASDQSADAKAAGDGAVRQLTSRPLLPTPVNNLLLDPFITSDTAWGHFLAVVPAANPDQTTDACPFITRELMSESPIGISGPTVLVNSTVLPPSTGCTAILSALVGSSEPVHAEIWVSLSDASGNPLPFPPATDDGVKVLEGLVTVALLPNSLPSSAALPAYPLEPTTAAGTGRVTIAGREWGQLGLPSPVSIPKGGWFSILVKNLDQGLLLAAPQVVPVGGSGSKWGADPALGPARMRPMTVLERGAIGQYGRHPPPPPPRRPGRPRD
jgi:hypothetical protein